MTLAMKRGEPRKAPPEPRNAPATAIGSGRVVNQLQRPCTRQALRDLRAIHAAAGNAAGLSSRYCANQRGGNGLAALAAASVLYYLRHREPRSTDNCAADVWVGKDLDGRSFRPQSNCRSDTRSCHRHGGRMAD